MKDHFGHMLGRALRGFTLSRFRFHSQGEFNNIYISCVYRGCKYCDYEVLVRALLQSAERLLVHLPTVGVL